MSLADLMPTVVSPGALFVALIFIGRQLEKKWPIEPDQSWPERLLDYKLVAVTFFLPRLLSPVFAVCAVTIVNAAGGGFIALRADGGWFVVSVIVFVVTNDFFGYWIHRAQHAVPALWAMHSLHHSAEALTFATGGRHFWFERLLFGAAFPVLGILFQAPNEVVLTSGVISFLPDGCAHLNVRVSLGRFALWIDNPQFHRIHHSVEPQHLNKNFAPLLPLWDLIFRTAWIPAKDEFPATGLKPCVKPATVFEGVFWPIRGLNPVQRLSRALASVRLTAITRLDRIRRGTV